MNRISFGWDNPEVGIVRLTLGDGWTWSELYTLNTDVAGLMRAVAHPVHLLMDFSQSRTMPMGGVMTHVRNVLGAYPPNCSTMVMVSRDMLVQRLISTFKTTYRTGLGNRVFIVPSFDEAYRFIEKRVSSGANSPQSWL